MKKLLLGTVALVALGATVPALAADLAARPVYTKAPAYAAPIYNWTGFYIGGHIGGDWLGNANFGGAAVSNSNNGAFLGGVQVGADYQFAGNFVVGIEGQYSFLASSNGGATFPGTIVYNESQRGLGSVTGRLGYAYGPALLYAKGGYAYADNRESVTVLGAPAAFGFSGNHSNGYTVGAGVEYMFAPSWSAKLEYMYYDFGKSSFITPAAVAPFGSFRTYDNTVKAGINYHFNWNNNGPVAARY